MDDEIDAQVRAQAFAFLERATEKHGDSIPYEELLRGFDFRGRRVPLVGPQGIFKPAVLDSIPLSITTAPLVPGKPRPYEDGVAADGLLWYCYRGTDPQHHENVGLRSAMTLRKPLVYLYGIVKGIYLPVWPVFIVEDDPRSLRFRIDLAVGSIGVGEARLVSDGTEIEKRYAARLTKQRLHQEEFRVRVLRAYQMRCAICRLRHIELLEAAHILPDHDVRSLPEVRNGLALCRLHHGAFDHHILGVRPDFVIEVRRDVLDEVDGPMLLHGLQGFAGAKLLVPRADVDKPARDFLEERYARFRKVG